MRVNCEIQIINRLLPSLNMAAKKKYRCSLALGKLPGVKTDRSKIFIHVCDLKNKEGTKYKIMNNIQAVFTKFVNEGKFTIQLREPSVDLCVRMEPSLAKGFLKLLHHALKNEKLDTLHLSHLNPVKQKQIEKPKTKLSITSRKDYPLSTTFPHTLEFLTITGIKLNRIENRMIKLKHLCSLNLSANQIADIPLELGSMSLTSLNISENRISQLPQNLFTGQIKKTLQILNVSNNDINYLPISIFKLKSLNTLNLANNKLAKLSLHFDKLSKLKVLNISHNLLSELPVSILNLFLESIDVSGNPFDAAIGIKMICGQSNRGVPTLKEIAAMFCIQHHPRSHKNQIPQVLGDYLDSYLRCVCNKVILSYCLLATILTSLNKFPSATVSQQGSIPTVLPFCSKKCWEKTQNREIIQLY